MEILINHIRTGINDVVATQIKYIAFLGVRCVGFWLRLMGY